jgi:hypothetical protein
MRYLFILLLSITITQELQVEGNLKVTGSIDAQGNPITNVGSPIQSDDAVNMGFLQTEMTGLAGMKPERIYRKNLGFEYQDPIFYSCTAPPNKIWIAKLSGFVEFVTINGNDISSYESSSFEFILLSGDDLNLESYNGGFQLMIYEYSISGSGSDQGLDYIEP